MYFLISSSILIGFSIITFYYTLKNRTDKIEKKLFLNEIGLAILFLIAGILFPFMIQFHSPELPKFTLNILWIITAIVFLFEIGVIGGYLFYNKLVLKKKPEIIMENNYTKFCHELKNSRNYNIKSDVGRKLLHLFTVVVIFSFWFLGLYLESLGILKKIGGMDSYSFAFWLIITTGFAFVFMFHMADLARLNAFYTLPQWAKNWYCKSMKDNEMETFVASTPMVLAFVPFIFLPFPLFAAIALITTGADGAAAIIGMKYGKHKINENSDKTLEGYIAGATTTFIIVIIMNLLFYSMMNLAILKILLMGILATIIFLFVDAFFDNFCDNMLNPILVGIGILIIYSLF
jgi:dolichol kinase